MAVHLPAAIAGALRWLGRVPWFAVIAAAIVLAALVGCTRGDFEVTRADGTSAKGTFWRFWTDTAVTASPETGFTYSSNPQQQQFLQALQGALLLRGVPMAAPNAPLPSPARPVPQAQPAPAPAPTPLPIEPDPEVDPFRFEPQSWAPRSRRILPPMLVAHESAMTPAVSHRPRHMTAMSPLRVELERIKRQLASL